jgi:hypothetical protein
VLLDEQEKRPQRGGELRPLIRTPEGTGRSPVGSPPLRSTPSSADESKRPDRESFPERPGNRTSGLENGRFAAHISEMTKPFRTRLLEVRVIALKPDRWEWQVCESDTPIAWGYETMRETAQTKGDDALFHLLSAG